MQKSLDFSETPSRDRLISALTCLLNHIPRESWFAYIGLVNGKHGSVEDIIKRSGKEAGIHNMYLDGVKLKVIKPSALSEQKAERIIANETEPIPQSAKLDIYFEVVKAEIKKDNSADFDSLEEIKQIVNGQLSIEKTIRDKLRNNHIINPDGN